MRPQATDKEWCDSCWRTCWGLLALTLIALALRLAGLGQEPLWSDEYYTLRAAGAPTAAEVIERTVRQDPHPPLYFLAIHAWLKWLPPTGWGLRLPSALFGALSPLLLFLLAASLFPNRKGVAWGAAALLTVSPMHVWYSQEARAYTMQVALELAALATLAYGIRKQSRRMLDPLLIASAILTVVAMQTHYFSAFVWGFVFLSLVVAWLSRRLLGQRIILPLVILAIGAAGPALGAIGRLRSGYGISWLPKTQDASVIFYALRAQWLGPLWSPLPSWMQGVAVAAALALSVLGMAWTVRRARRDWLAAWFLIAGCALTWLLPIAISFLKPIIFYGQRYLIIAQPFFMLMLAAGAFGHRGRPAWVPKVLLAVVLLAQTAYLTESYAYQQKHPWDRAAQWLAGQLGPADRVFVLPGYDAGLLARDLGNTRTVEELYDNTPLGPRLGDFRGRVWVIGYGDLSRWLAATCPGRPFELVQRFLPKDTSNTIWIYASEEGRPASATASP